MKRKFRTNLLHVAALLAASVFAFTGCGGGADTTENQVTTGPTAGPTYAGPPAATADIQSFNVNFWSKVRTTDRCGNCHNAGGQMPNFARSDDVNLAYQQASNIVDRNTPSQSPLVLKVAGGHNCWLADASACASILTRWITDWVGATDSSGKQIQLIAPPSKDVGTSRRFTPNAPPSFYTDSNGTRSVYTLTSTYCSGCHQSDSQTKQSPYFAAPIPAGETAPEEAYHAATAKINLETPVDSRFVIRLGRESHNCWSDCATNAAEMQKAIEMMRADPLLAPKTVDSNLIVSKALTMFDGTVASGGSRVETSQIALYEFKSGDGGVAFDTSGVEPAADLVLNGAQNSDYEWVGGWGILFKSKIAKAQASAASSKKFRQLITATGEYSIEAWVVPGNVTQEDTRIVSYSGSKTARNFTMGQTLYNYDYLNRSTATDSNGMVTLSTKDADKRLQAALQHVVMTFDPVNGRRIYVNGEFTGGVDAQGGGTLGEWDDSFAFVLGNEVSNDRPWAGVVRLVAVHNRALTLTQIKQNFAAGVGQKYFLLFGVSHIIDVPKAYVLFEVSEYDSHGYLFNNPKFVSLDGDAKPEGIALKGMRIGLNGAEPPVGQAYRLLDLTLASANYSPATGQSLSTVGTVIPREIGPDTDEFFLCFDQLGTKSNVCSTYAAGVPQGDATPDMVSKIGVRTFDAINASMAKLTGVDPNNARIKATYANIRQSLPAQPDMAAFLSSHQTSIAQLALQYCSVMVDDVGLRATFFNGANLSGLTLPAQKAAIIGPVTAKIVGTVGSQPTAAEMDAALTLLINGDPTPPAQLGLCPSGSCTGDRAVVIAKAVCGAALGSAAVLVQ